MKKNIIESKFSDKILIIYVFCRIIVINRLYFSRFFWSLINFIGDMKKDWINRKVGYLMSVLFKLREKK